MQLLPEKTVERLSEYRRTLLRCLDEGKAHIFSHELAQMHNITAVQVRRDIMFIAFTSPRRKGYHIKDLIRKIGEVIDPVVAYNIAVVGYGNLGKAVTAYFSGKRPKLNLVAVFDIDPKKIGSEYNGIKCYSIDQLREILNSRDITIAILTVPPAVAQDMAKILVASGIKGILNFTSVTLNLPPEIYHANYDMITSIEKVAYFVKNKIIR
ncbi:MAG: redox-sensing transcriptional repressor Rex [Bacteroidales bacterium]|nr:redox-sensing transcriptional repressor Rex [Bacteroidales bacterium]